MEKILLLGFVPPSPGNETGFMLTFRPAGSKYSEVPLVGLYEPMEHGEGGETDAGTWLARNSENWKPDREGWFERLCHSANCDWLMPVLRRLAKEEKISKEEIKDLYSANNNGNPIKEGSISEFFDMVQKNRKE